MTTGQSRQKGIVCVRGCSGLDQGESPQRDEGWLIESPVERVSGNLKKSSNVNHSKRQAQDEIKMLTSHTIAIPAPFAFTA